MWGLHLWANSLYCMSNMTSGKNPLIKFCLIKGIKRYLLQEAMWYHHFCTEVTFIQHLFSSYLLCQKLPVPTCLCCSADVSRTEERHDVERQKSRQHSSEVHPTDGNWFCQTIIGEPESSESSQLTKVLSKNVWLLCVNWVRSDSMHCEFTWAASWSIFSAVDK